MRDLNFCVRVSSSTIGYKWIHFQHLLLNYSLEDIQSIKILQVTWFPFVRTSWFPSIFLLQSGLSLIVMSLYSTKIFLVYWTSTFTLVPLRLEWSSQVVVYTRPSSFLVVSTSIQLNIIGHTPCLFFFFLFLFLCLGVSGHLIVLHLIVWVLPSGSSFLPFLYYQLL